MAVQVERLVAVLEARLDKFEKGVSKASGHATREFKKITKAGDRMEARLSKLGDFAVTFGKGLFAGVAAGGVAGIVAKISEVARSIAQVGDEAKRAGVSAQAFQEWKFVAEQNRIGIDQMTDGLKELNLRADEFVQTGKGSAAEAFQRLGYDAADLKKKLEDPSRLLLEIIDRLGKFDQAAQIRISDELFGGTAGERFVELLAQGEDGIRRTIDQAHELGAVMDDDVIAKAAELDRKFNQITATVSTGLKTAIVEAADALSDFVNVFQKMMNDMEQRRAAARMGDLAGSLVNSPPGAGPINHTTPKTDRLPKAAWAPPVPPPGGFGSSSTGGRGGGRLNDYQREVRQIRERKAALLAEAAAIAGINPLIEDYGYALEKARARQDLLTAAKRAGIAITPKLESKIDELAGSYAAAGTEAERLAESQDRARRTAEELRDLGKDVMGGFIHDLVDGKSAADALADALGKIGDKLLDMALTSMFSSGGIFGGGGGLLGGLLIPGILHEGGVAGRDGYGHGRAVSPSAFAGARRYHRGGIAGLQPGEVPAILQRGEVVLPKGGMVAGGDGATVDVRVAVDQNGNLQAYVERTAGRVSAHIVQGSIPSTVRQATDAVQQRVYRQPSYLRS